MRGWAIALWILAPMLLIVLIADAATSTQSFEWRWVFNLIPVILCTNGFTLWRFSDPVYSGYPDVADAGPQYPPE